MSKLTISLVAVIAVLGITLGALYGTSVLAGGNNPASVVVIATDTDDTIGSASGDSIKVFVSEDTDFELITTGKAVCHDKSDKEVLSAVIDGASITGSGFEPILDLETDGFGDIQIHINGAGQLVVHWPDNPCDIANDPDGTSDLEDPMRTGSSGTPGDAVRVILEGK